MAEKKEKRYVSDNAQLMAEWDWGKNEDLGFDPTKITCGSNKKVNWICSKGHRYTASVYHRTSRSSGCPYCSSKRILPGYNDLQSKRPDLMSEWDFLANTINPSTVAVKSNKFAHWICPKGHKYIKRICNRSNGEDCPTCSQARRTSFPEQCFYFYIKKRFPDAINSYRDIFDNGMELDIYIPSLRIGIEYDGIFWHSGSALLREKTKYRICKENHIKLIRIKEGNFVEFDEVADEVRYIPKKCSYNLLSFYIVEFLKRLAFFTGTIPDVNVARDKNAILEYKTLRIEDSLLSQCPEIACEWHPTKNGKLTPDLFIPGSSEIVWWLCSVCGNEWTTSIVNRTKGHGCDVCATVKRKITKKTTLIQKRGSIDKEWCLLDWDYDANEFGPEHYTNGSSEIVNWRCHKCSHKWKAAICSRTRDYKNGCPLCSGKTIASGVNDLATVLPELLIDWDYDANVTIDPTKVGRGSHEIASWKCHKCGYKWKAQIYNRANGRGCPDCAKKRRAEGQRKRALQKSGSLAERCPHLSEQWHPIKNGDLTPHLITPGSDHKAWWLCPDCKHEWEASVGSRSRGAGCPKCAFKKVDKLWQIISPKDSQRKERKR